MEEQMRNTILSLFVLILFTTITFAQSGWYGQNSGTNKYLFDIHFVNQNTGWACGQTGTILYTSDGGDDWTDLNAPPINYYSGIHFVDETTGWVVGFGGRVQRTTDAGVTWTVQNTPTQYNISDVQFVNTNTGWTVGGKARTFTDPIREILCSSNGGATWTTQYFVSNEEPLASIYFLDENYGWAVGAMSTIMKTSDGGNNWTIQMSGTGYEFEDVYFINRDTGWVVGQDLSLQHYAVIFSTVDGGTTWSSQTFGSDDSFQGVYFVDKNNGWVVGGSNNEAIILYTSDGGTNWIQQTANTSNLLSAVNFSDENNGWAVGVNGTIIHTETTIPVELNSFAANVLNDNVNLFWETATETSNSGFEIQRSGLNKDYKKIGFVVGNGTTLEITKYSFTDKDVPAGNYYYRLVQIDLDGTRNTHNPVRVNVITSQPEEYSLSQNFPNPFNPSTKINFSIPTESFVSLKVFNSLGEEIETLFAEELNAGSYKYDWNAINLPSGIYFYRLQAADFMETKKMMLLR
jgi:photosystem II stability/assembly factor-like uncharacterized protein